MNNIRIWRDLLPIEPPSLKEESPSFFYHNVVSKLIPDMIKLMDQGLYIDQDAVEELRNTLIDVLDKVETTLANNSIIQKFQQEQYKTKYEEFKAEKLKSCRDYTYYLKECKWAVQERTFIVNTYLDEIGRSNDKKDKWSVKDLKTYNEYLDDNFIRLVIDKKANVSKYMELLAKEKARLWNKVREDAVSNAKFEDIVPPFNPGSSKQKIEFFEFMGIEPISLTDGGQPQWSRTNIEQVLAVTTDEEFKDILQAFIDHSFSAIVKGTFIEAFDAYTVDGVLHSNIKLFGAKSLI